MPAVDQETLLRIVVIVCVTVIFVANAFARGRR